MALNPTSRFTFWRAHEHGTLRLGRAALLVSLAAFMAILWVKRHNPALGTDSLIYHLSIPALWLQNGLLSELDLPFHDSAAEHSPMLSQLVAYLLMRLTSDTSLTWLVQPMFLLVLLRFFYLSVRLVGLGRPPAMLLTALLLLFKPFVDSVLLTNNDLTLTLGAAVALYGLLRMSVHTRAGLLWGVAGTAMLLASKHVGVIYAGVMVLLYLGVWRLRRRPNDMLRALKLRHLAAALALLILGASFLLKNWVLYGNPMYPARITLASFVLFEGLYDSSVLIDHGWSLNAVRMMLVRASDVRFALNPPASIMLWLGVAICLMTALQRRKHSRARWFRLAATVLFPLAAVVVFFACVPFWREHRLLFPVYYAFWLAGGSALAVIQRRLRHQRFGQSIIPVALAALLIAQLVAHDLTTQTWFYFVFPVALIIATLKPPAMCRWRRGAAVVCLVLAIACAVVWSYPGYQAARVTQRNLLYASTYRSLGRAWLNIEDRTNAAGAGQTIAYSGTPIIFPLFGRQLQNRVRYIPISPDDRPTPITLHQGDSVYLRLAVARRRRIDATYWLTQLERQHVDLVYLYDDPNQGGVQAELDIIDGNPDRFEPLIHEGRVYLFRFGQR